MTYPHSTGFVKHSTTSRASAAALDASGQAKKYDEMFIDILERWGTAGGTAEECRKVINEKHPNFHNGSANANLSKLWKQKKVIKTSLKRKTDSGKEAHVYVLAAHRMHFAAQGMIEPEYVHAKPQRGTNELKYQKALQDAKQQLAITGYGAEHQPLMDIITKALEN